MKYILLIMGFSFVFSNAFALSATELKNDKTLFLKKSNGPSYKQNIIDHALAYWEENEDFYNLFDDGMNHDALEQCEPKNYRLSNEEIIDSGSPWLDVDFMSIKKSKSSRSIAYLVYPTATYTITYTYYRSHADYKRDKETLETVSCRVRYSTGYYYENTKDKSVKFLGTDEVDAELETGMFFNGESMKDEAVAEAFFKALKQSEETDEDVDVCYKGNWEQSLNYVNKIIEILVNDIYGETKGAPLDVEVEHKEGGSTYGIIQGC